MWEVQSKMKNIQKTVENRLKKGQFDSKQLILTKLPELYDTRYVGYSMKNDNSYDGDKIN
jgi:hypothetical protein